jgi:hypothetical protein
LGSLAGHIMQKKLTYNNLESGQSTQLAKSCQASSQDPLLSNMHAHQS